MGKINIPEALFYDLVAYFILGREDMELLGRITEGMEDKVGRMARHLAYTQAMQAGN